VGRWVCPHVGCKSDYSEVIAAHNHALDHRREQHIRCWSELGHLGKCTWCTKWAAQLGKAHEVIGSKSKREKRSSSRRLREDVEVEPDSGEEMEEKLAADGDDDWQGDDGAGIPRAQSHLKDGGLKRPRRARKRSQRTPSDSGSEAADLSPEGLVSCLRGPVVFHSVAQ
jgi:hypothetical protein